MLECPASVSNFTQDYCVGNMQVWSEKTFPFGFHSSTLLLFFIGFLLMFKEKSMEDKK